MKFVKNANPDMSSLQGYVRTDYDKLVKVFGKPDYEVDFGDPNLDGKVTCEWALKFSDGTIATIYNYKTGFTPMEEYDWHVGGFNKYAVKRVQECLDGK